MRRQQVRPASALQLVLAATRGAQVVLVPALPSTKTVAGLAVSVAGQKPKPTRAAIHGVIPPASAPIPAAVSRGPAAPLGVGPRGGPLRLAATGRLVPRTATCTGAHARTTILVATTTLAGVRPAGLNEGPRVPVDVPAPLRTTRRVAETVRPITTPLVLEVMAGATVP